MLNKKRAVMLKVLADFRLGLSLAKERGMIQVSSGSMPEI